MYYCCIGIKVLRKVQQRCSCWSSGSSFGWNTFLPTTFLSHETASHIPEGGWLTTFAACETIICFTCLRHWHLFLGLPIVPSTDHSSCCLFLFQNGRLDRRIRIMYG